MNDWHHEMAEDIIRSHVEDIEYSAVGEAIQGEDDVPDGDYSAHQAAIHDLILKAHVTVTWPTA